MKILLSIALFLTLAGDTLAADKEAEVGSSYFYDMLVQAKYTGMCGAFRQMGLFQESTKMPGGDEFITRFISTEATRMNVSFEQLLSRCSMTAKAYNAAMNTER
jgi:hypothetical protein